MATFKSKSLTALALILCACGSAGEGPDPETVASSRSEIVDVSRVLGFENLADWTASSGSLSLGTPKTQGAASLAIDNFTYTELRSVPLTSLSDVTSTIAFDLRPPINMGWGFAQLYIDCPSRGIYTAFAGHVDLTGSAANAFRQVAFSLAPNVVSALQGSYSDLTFKIALSIPYGSGRYRVDNLRFTSGVACTAPTAGMVLTSNTTLCAGTYPMNVAAGAAAITVGANNVKVTCNGTVIQGSGAIGPTENPNEGFLIDGRSGVTIQGCTAKSFRYGAVVRGSSNTTLDGVHLDDNFTDPAAGWTQDSVQGGGIRLENSSGTVVKNSSFARNWNGIELRGASSSSITGNVADHCSNTGATLVASNGNTLKSNDFSWGIRGDGLTYPTVWYGADTRDSAGIIVDAGSSQNVIESNDVRYGGDGVFLRSVIGACAENNRIVNNDTSYSPNNAIESWCDGNEFTGNIASFSNYGLWLGGSDRAKVIGNTVDSSRTDGISVQIGEDRHSVFQDNVIKNSGRVGLLLTGREYQAWDPLTNWSPNLANSSHLVVQRNTFTNNAVYDVFTTSTRSLVLASNCLTPSKLNLSTETEVTASFGTCNGATGRTPPNAVLADPGNVNRGASVTLNASGSSPSPSGGTLSYTWLVQSAGTRFASGQLPALVSGGSGGATRTVTFPEPGFYDVDVTVGDGFLASLATRTVAVAPAGVRVGELASQWTYVCVDQPDCVTTFADDPAGVSGTAVHAVTTAAFDFSMIAPAAKNLGLNASSSTKLGFFIKAKNVNSYGWQGNFPFVVLGSPAGIIQYAPAANLLPTQPTEWLYVEIPLNPAADSGWTRTDAGGSLAQVNWIELHADTWDSGFELWVDAVTFY